MTVAQAETTAPGRYFFVHIMKTAGSSLASQLWKLFRSGRLYGYGDPSASFILSTYLYLNPRPLAHLPSSFLDQVQLFGGHFPFAATSFVDERIETITLLRDPVDRVVSFLNHAKRFHVEHADLAPEEIYEDEWFFARFMDNHEVKMFSMTVEEMLADTDTEERRAEGWDQEQLSLLHRWRIDPRALTDGERQTFHELVVEEMETTRGMYRVMGAPNTSVVEVDDARLKLAVENLEQIDLLGFHDKYSEFLADLSHRLGRTLSADLERNVGPPFAVSDALRRRIADDLGPSLELYEHARTVARA